MSNQRLPLLILCCGLLAALVPALWRLSVERAHRHVAIVADAAEIQQLAAFSQRPAADVMADLQDAGLTAVAIEEPLVDDLVKSGALRITPTDDGLELQASGERAQRALAGLRYRFGGRIHDGAVRLDLPFSALTELGAGLDPNDFAAARALGLGTIARLRNSPGVSPAWIESQLGIAQRFSAEAVIFSGDSVLGYRELTAATARALATDQLPWGRVEFAKQKGEAALAEKLLTPALGQAYLRVHSITEGEMAKTTPAVAIERYRRAAVERNIRVLFVRLFLDPAPDPLQRNREFVASIASALASAGLATGPPDTLPFRSVSALRVLPIGIFGVCAATAWLLALLPGYTTKRWLLGWLALVLLTSPIGLLKPALYASLMGLLAGCVLPSIGARWAWLRLSEAGPRGVVADLATVWGAAAWSVLGGLLVVGLFAETRYQLAHQAYSGVKLAQLVPLLAAGLLIATGLSLPGVGVESAKARARALWQRPVLTAHVVLTGTALVLVLVMLVRSGNEGLEVSSTEMRFRTLLEHLFGARPRTKEVLLGYPALMLAARQASAGRRGWVAPCYLLGVIGLLSSFNTFCHFHTPLSQSLLRTFHALWVGCLLGLLAFAVLNLLARRRETAGG